MTRKATSLMLALLMPIVGIVSCSKDSTIQPMKLAFGSYRIIGIPKLARFAVLY